MWKTKHVYDPGSEHSSECAEITVGEGLAVGFKIFDRETGVVRIGAEEVTPEPVKAALSTVAGLSDEEIKAQHIESIKGLIEASIEDQADYEDIDVLDTAGVQGGLT